MVLNQEGIRQLKFDLRANAERYSQGTFGTVQQTGCNYDNRQECSTVCCMAGLCLTRKVGQAEFTRLVVWARRFGTHYGFGRMCMMAAAEQLGLRLFTETEYARMQPLLDSEVNVLPPIFGSPKFWPSDLRDRFYAASAKDDRQAVAEVACDALDRMDEHGCIAPLLVATREEEEAALTVAGD